MTDDRTTPGPRDELDVLGLLTDGGDRVVLGAAAEAAGLDLLDHTRRSVHHRSGRSYAEVHAATVAFDGQTREVLLVLCRDLRGVPDGAFVLRQGDIEVAVWRFPHDPYLPGLPSAIDAVRVRELLDRLGAPPGEVRLHTRAYRPARRAVVEVAIEGPEAQGRVLYLKVLAGTRARELASIHETLAGHVPVPRIWGVADAQGIVAMEALGGATLRAALAQGLALPEPEELVGLTTRLAASGLGGRRDPRAFADPRRHVAGLARLIPARAEAIRRLADQAARIEAPVVPVHGDLHDAQILLASDGTVTGLLDVDGAGPGWLVQDAANLIAHVAVVAEIDPRRAAVAEWYAAALTEAFLPHVGATTLARASAGAWIALATGPHRAQDVDWRERTESRLDRAAAALAGTA